MIVESLMFEAGSNGSICTVENLTQGVHVIRGPRASGKSSAHRLAALTLFGRDDRDRRRHAGPQEQAHYLLADCDRQPGVEPGQPVALHAKAFNRRQLAALRRWYAPDFTSEDPRQALREHLGFVRSLDSGHALQTQHRPIAHHQTAEVIQAEMVRLDESIAGLNGQLDHWQQQRQSTLQTGQAAARETAAQVLAEIEHEIRRLEDPTSCDLCTCRQFPARLRPLLQSLHQCLDESADGAEVSEQDAYHALVRQLNDETQRLTELRQNRDEPADQLSFEVETESASADIWPRAAEYLARMSVGDLTQIAPADVADGFRFCNDRGHWISLDALSVDACDMVRLSLTLALADRHHRDGVQLPLLLDEPSRNLDTRSGTALLSLLEESARDGRQIVMFLVDELPIHELLERGFTVHQIGHQDRRCCPHCGTSDEEQQITLTSEHWWNSQSSDPGEILDIDSHRAAMHPSNLQEDVDRSPTDGRTTGSGNPAGRWGPSGNRGSRKIRQRKKRTGQRKTLRRSQGRTEPGVKSDRSSRVTTSQSLSGQDIRTERSTAKQSRGTSAGRKTSQRRAMNRRPDTTDTQGELARDSRSAPAAVERSEAKQAGETTRALRYYLTTADPVVDAPEIGPKMAERLATIGIHTVQDLLRADPQSTAERLKQRRTNAEAVRRWQDQARLMCQVPQIRGHDAQILVACRITQPQQLAASNAETLYAAVAPFSTSKAGARIIRGGQQPDLAEVRDWISWAQSAAGASAA